jgi:anti-sigma B factor antagonist
MPVRGLEVEVRQLSGAAVIHLRGEIDATTEGTLDAAYAEATGSDPPAVLLNFEQVDYINSTGIALIVGVLARARKSGRRLLVCGLSQHYLEVFHITRLADFMSIYPDEDSALAGGVPKR